MNIVTVLIILISEPVLVSGLLGLLKLPVRAHVVDLALVVEFGVVLLANSPPALPQGQVLWVDGNTVVLGFTTLTDVSESALLLLEIKTGGVWEPDEGDEHTSKTEPRNDVELLLGSNVVIED